MSEKLSEEQLERVLDISEKNMTEGFRNFSLKYGPIDPALLPISEDQELRRLFWVYDSWVKTQQKKVDEAGGTIEAQLKMALKVTPFFVDVGFTDPGYIDEVISDWMAQDLAQAEDEGLDEIAASIRNKIEEIRKLLPESA